MWAFFSILFSESTRFIFSCKFFQHYLSLLVSLFYTFNDFYDHDIQTLDRYTCFQSLIKASILQMEAGTMFWTSPKGLIVQFPSESIILLITFQKTCTHSKKYVKYFQLNLVWRFWNCKMQNNTAGKANYSFRPNMYITKNWQGSVCCFIVRCVYTEKQKNKDNHKNRMWLEKPPLSAENIAHEPELINKARNLFITFLASHWITSEIFYSLKSLAALSIRPVILNK